MLKPVTGPQKSTMIQRNMLPAPKIMILFFSKMSSSLVFHKSKYFLEYQAVQVYIWINAVI